MLKAGIVGLPNVGKSTLFNALTRSHKAAAENYPFCTIEPNLGVVQVPDERLNRIAAVVKVQALIPTAFEFVDIAGLVKGASEGEGLGNQFLGHIREVDAVAHVVRCFEDPDIVHITGSPEPERDIDIVNAELLLADLQTVHKRQEKISRDVKRGDKHALLESHLLEALNAHLAAGKPANTLARPLSPDERAVVRSFCLLTDKPAIYVANLKEGELASAQSNPFVARVREYALRHHASDTVVLCAKLESDLADLSPEEGAEFLSALGIKEPGLNGLIQSTYRLLSLRTFFTFNEREVRAWTVRAGTTAVQAAGVIHTDFEKGFIKAEVVHWEDLVQRGSVSHARESGHYRIEGRDYEVRDGDVILFKVST